MWFNTLVLSRPTGESYVKHRHRGVIATCCWPAQYYAGYIYQDQDGQWHNSYNDTHLFHRTKEEALAVLGNFATEGSKS